MTGHGDDADADLKEAGAEKIGTEEEADQDGPTTRRTMIAVGGAAPIAAPAQQRPEPSEDPHPQAASDARPPHVDAEDGSSRSASARFVARRAFAPAPPKGRHERTPPAGHPMRETPGHFPNAEFSLVSLTAQHTIERGPLLGDTGPFPEAATDTSPSEDQRPSDAPEASPDAEEDSMEVTAPHPPLSGEALSAAIVSHRGRGGDDSPRDQDAPTTPSVSSEGSADPTAKGEGRDNGTDDLPVDPAPTRDARDAGTSNTSAGDPTMTPPQSETGARRPSSATLWIVGVVALAVSYYFGSAYFSGDPPAEDRLATAVTPGSRDGGADPRGTNEAASLPPKKLTPGDAAGAERPPSPPVAIEAEDSPPTAADPALAPADAGATAADPAPAPSEPAPAPAPALAPADAEATAADPAPAPDPDPAPAPAPDPAPAPAAPDDEPAPAPAPDPAPAPAPAAPDDEPRPPPPPTADSLARAQATVASDPRRAFELTTTLLDGPDRHGALEVRTLAACTFDDGMVARQAFVQLRGAERRVRVFDQCLSEHQINLRYAAHDYHYRELIRMSQRALDEGKFAEAYDLARTSFSQRRSPEAGVLLGKLNCALNRKGRAEVIAIKSREEHRAVIVAYCATKGITLDTSPSSEP